MVFESEVLEEDTIGIQIMKARPKLNGRSRCGQNGKLVGLTCCGDIRPVYHLSFSGLWCNICDHAVDKEDLVDMGNQK